MKSTERLLVAALVCGLLSAAASAATVSGLEVRVDDREINAAYDELGNNAYPGQYLAVGDSSGSPATGIGELRTVCEFDIQAVAADILASDKVTFSIQYSKTSGSPQHFQLWALSADEDGVVTPDDYQADGTFVAEFNPADYSVLGDLIVADVTAFVQADALAGQQFSAYRFQVANPADCPNNSGLDGRSDAVEFVMGSSLLAFTPVPEPMSMVVLGLGGFGVLAKRRRA